MDSRNVGKGLSALVVEDDLIAQIGEMDSSVGKGLSALVVDDDPVAQMIHKGLLERYGLETQVVKNGAEAIVLHSIGARFDLILMDKEMPIKDGVHATRELREMGVNSMIVGVTSNEPGADMVAFIGSGLNECLIKPLTAENVYGLINLLA